jgi:hypothetical protein
MGLFDWLFGRKALANAEHRELRAERPPGTSWQAGHRVLASWVDAYFYPGRIRQVQGAACEIAFDDGDVAWVHEANVRQLDIHLGSQVFCRFQGGPMYMPGSVEQQNGEKIRVKYENGEKEWTTISMVRVKRRLADVAGPPAQVRQGPLASGPELAGPVMGAMSGLTGGPMMGGPTTGTLTSTGPLAAPPGQGHIPDVGDPVADSNWRVGDRVLGGGLIYSGILPRSWPLAPRAITSSSMTAINASSWTWD